MKTVRARTRTPRLYIYSTRLLEQWWHRRIFFPLGGTKREVFAHIFHCSQRNVRLRVSFSFSVILARYIFLSIYLSLFHLSLFLSFSFSLYLFPRSFSNALACYMCVRFSPSRSVCVTFAACASTKLNAGKARREIYSRGMYTVLIVKRRFRCSASECPSAEIRARDI